MRKSAALIFIARSAKLLIGLIGVSLSAKYFGISHDKDNWIIAVSLITAIDATIWGALNEMFRTKFIFLKHEFGENQAIAMTKSLLFFMLLFSVCIAFVYFLSVDFVVFSLSLENSPSESEKLKSLIYLTIPFLLINQLSAIGSSILNAFNIFFIAEFVGILVAGINLFVLIFLAPIIGINALVVSYYVASLMLLFVVFFYLKFKLKINFFDAYNEINFSGFKIFYVAAIPLFFNYLIGQSSNLYEKFMSASYGIGNLAILDYSRKFSDILQSVISGVLMTILVPVLSSRFVDKERDAFVNDFLNLYKIALIGITFIVSFFLSSSSELVDILYNKGSISNSGLSQISILMQIYGFSVLGVFHFMIFGLVLLSIGSSKKFALLSVLTQLFSMGLSFIFLPRVGISIFPFSIAFSHFIVSLFFVWRFPFERSRVILIMMRYLIYLLSVVLSVQFLARFSNYYELSSYAIALSNISVILSVMMLFGFIYKLGEFNLFSTYIRVMFFSRR